MRQKKINFKMIFYVSIYIIELCLSSSFCQVINYHSQKINLAVLGIDNPNSATNTINLTKISDILDGNTLMHQ